MFTTLSEKCNQQEVVEAPDRVDHPLVEEEAQEEGDLGFSRKRCKICENNDTMLNSIFYSISLNLPLFLVENI